MDSESFGIYDKMDSIYIIGGSSDSSGLIQNEVICWRYSLQNDSYSKISSIPQQLEYVCGCLLNDGRIFVCWTKYVYIYDSKVDEWTPYQFNEMERISVKSAIVSDGMI